MEHIGDGVYVDLDQGSLRLSTPRENGTHEIFLDAYTTIELFRYLDRRHILQQIMEKVK
jgi:hypothetical protein